MLALSLFVWMGAFALLLEGALRKGAADRLARIEHPGLLLDPARFLLAIMMIFAIVVVLLAAATVRRLHDRGRSGAWALLPLPFLVIGFGALPMMFDGADETRRAAMPWLFLNNLAYLVALGILVAMLVRKGTPGPNAYGPDPAAASS